MERRRLYSHAATVLPVTDMPRSRRFYHELLGFSVDFEWQEPPTYAVLTAGDSVSLHLALADDPREVERRRAVVYVFVHDVDALHRALADAGVEIHSPLETMEYGMREFEVVDPDGHRLVLAQGGAEPAEGGS